jgi:two-component system sensor histidine kinase/response regulator
MLQIAAASGDSTMARILSLDDEPAMLLLYRLILERAGYEYTWTTNSFEALDLLRSDPPDLFTQDWVRPDLDGPRLYRQMKADPALRQIPVLFITARHRPEFVCMVCTTYDDDYLVKPISPKELLERVEQALKRHSRQR